MSQSQYQYNVKSVYGDDIRRFTLSDLNGTTASGELQHAIAGRYSIPVEQLVLRYVDEDGDKVTIAGAEDATLFLKNYASGSKVGKVIVSVKGSNSTSTSTNTTTPVSTTTSTQTRIPTGRQPVAKPVQQVTASIPGATLDIELDSPLHKHVLKYISNAYNGNGYICDSCNVTGAPSKHSWHCKPCGYDLCDKCAQPQIPKTESKTDSSTTGNNSTAENKNELLDQILPLLHNVLSDAKVKQALPAALVVGVDSFIVGSNAQTIINTVVASNEDISNNVAVQRLVREYLPRIVPLLDQSITHIRPFIATNNTQMIDLVKSLIPVFAPNVINSIDAQLVNIINTRKDNDNSIDYTGLFNVFSSLPFLSGVPLNNIFNQFQQQQQSSAQEPNLDFLNDLFGPTGGPNPFGVDMGALAGLFGGRHGRHGHGHHGGRHGPGRHHHGDDESELKHTGVCCDGCDKKHWVGERYRCTTCADYDLCQDCIKGTAKQQHDATHQFVSIEPRGKFWGDRPHGRHQGHWWRNGGGRCGRFNDRTAQPSVAFIGDTTLPDRSEVPADSVLIKTWSVKNDSTVPWPTDSKLIFIRGDRELSYSEEFSVPIAQPNETVEISAVLNTPSKTGRYNAYYKLADSNRVPFGPMLWCDLLVVAKPTETTPQPTEPVTVTPEAAVEESKTAEPTIEQAAAVESTVEATEQELVNSAVASTTESQRSVSPTGSTDSKKWNVVIESDDEDEKKYDIVDSVEVRPITTQQPTTETKSTEPVKQESTDYSKQLDLLHELGFTNDALNVFLLKQNNGEIKKVVEWLVEKLQ